MKHHITIIVSVLYSLSVSLIMTKFQVRYKICHIFRLSYDITMTGQYNDILIKTHRLIVFFQGFDDFMKNREYLEF